MIKKIDLSGIWNFELDPDKKGIEARLFDKTKNDTITLPGTTSIAKKGTFSDKKETGFLTDPYLFEGYAWYSKDVHIDESDTDKNIFLFLERTRLTKIWIDDTFAGEFDSLTTPHYYDITRFVKKTDFRITVLVSNVNYPTKGGHLTSPDTQTNWNGIIGEISLRIFDKIYISDVKTYPDVDKKSVTVILKTVNDTAEDKKVTLNVNAFLTDINGDTGIKAPAAEIQVIFAKGESTAEFEYFLGEDAVLWSEYTPVIYRLEISLCGSDEKTVTTFGLRKFSTTETKFLINGEPAFLRGKHDGLVFPLTGAVPADVDEWVRVMKISKSYGINHYRYHTCCPPEAAFIAADLLGIYMEPQLPFWGTLTAPGDENHNETEQNYLIEEGFRMLNTFGNHASYCMMSLGNELWGSKERMAEIITGYRNVDNRHLYTQGSNNFQHTPVLLPEDDFFVGVRFSKNRLIRGSYGMCDAPLGHIQWEEPSTTHNYDKEIVPDDENSGNGTDAGEEIEIQYGTGVKKVKAASADGPLIPHIPVVTHEIGQYAVYPNFKEIPKYTGVLKARNFEVFRDNLDKKGMLDQADDFFYASGMLSVQCYKEELEAAARSSLVAGYQILDLQDFPGQGTALVGILDAFMDSKGHITPEEWAGFCSDAILLAQFEKYVYTSGENFKADLAIRYYNPEKLTGKKLHYELIRRDVSAAETTGFAVNGETSVVTSGDVKIPDGAKELVQLGGISFAMPETDKTAVYDLILTIDGTPYKNKYELYCYPVNDDVLSLENIASIGEGDNQVFITNEFTETKSLLKQGKKVLFMPNEVKESLEGFYCTDFWCYPMFRDICEWMKKPVAVGTMGLLIDSSHPALNDFATHRYSTPQWYKIVSHSRCAILDDVTDKDYRPIVQMADNFERNHKLGILFEGKAGDGKLMVCTSKLGEIAESTEVKQFIKSLVNYLTSDVFAPEKELDLEKLETIF
ncbi:beta-glucuronidase [Clostridium sp. AM27-31LB]|uniref:sugar-binding domain-containing protein n=1 Tax=Clostridium sp. AM27-31LB TaxID=2293026 RepID=UPI000E4D7F39|nr:sugar-binding domain-containing protein [Clostridium sp. AM27-31LB]RHT93437.1 beta-glucuronidase [Clostridium sp. AM27-31LB]